MTLFNLNSTKTKQFVLPETYLCSKIFYPNCIEAEKYIHRKQNRRKNIIQISNRT